MFERQLGLDRLLAVARARGLEPALGRSDLDGLDGHDQLSAGADERAVPHVLRFAEQHQALLEVRARPNQPRRRLNQRFEHQDARKHRIGRKMIGQVLFRQAEILDADDPFRRRQFHNAVNQIESHRSLRRPLYNRKAAACQAFLHPPPVKDAKFSRPRSPLQAKKPGRRGRRSAPGVRRAAGGTGGLSTSVPGARGTGCKQPVAPCETRCRGR